MCIVLLIALLITAPLAVVAACKLGYARGRDHGIDEAIEMLVPHLRGPE